MKPIALARALVVSSVLCLALGSSVARAEDAIYAPAADAHAPGRWSLKFAIEDNFTLGSFDGSSISATKNTSENRAWRYGISFGGLFSGQSVANSALPDTLVPPPPGGRNENSSVNLGLSVLRVHRIQASRRIGAYLELGPAVSWSHQQSLAGSDPVAGVDFEADRYQHSLFFGATFNLGAEVFVARSISLAADYGMDVGYSTAEQTVRATWTDVATGATTQRFETVAKVHNWSVSDSGVRFGVSLYL